MAADDEVSSTTVLDLVVMEPVVIDMALFEEWVRGTPVRECAKNRQDRSRMISMRNLPSQQQLTRLHQCIARETHNQYRHFRQLERWLLDPRLMRQHCTMRIPVATQTALLHAYYSLDERFSRLLAGKRLTPKLRRTTQLVEQCGVTLRSFERQFDNLKRVFDRVYGEDDEKAPERPQSSAIMAEVHQSFDLSEDLSERYAILVFLSYHKMDTHSKEALSSLTFAQVGAVAKSLMAKWSVFDRVGHLDYSFLDKLAHVRILQDAKDGREAYRNASMRKFRQILIHAGNMSATTSERIHKLSHLFTIILKALIAIAEDVSKRDLADLLVDLVEAVVSPLLDEGLSDAEVTTLLPLYVTCFDAKFYDKDPGVHDQVEDITPIWKRFLEPVRDTVILLYARAQAR